MTHTLSKEGAIININVRNVSHVSSSGRLIIQLLKFTLKCGKGKQGGLKRTNTFETQRSTNYKNHFKTMKNLSINVLYLDLLKPMQLDSLGQIIPIFNPSSHDLYTLLGKKGSPKSQTSKTIGRRRYN